MPLDFTTANSVTPVLVNLAPKTWRDELVRAAGLRRAKTVADKAAREADSTWKTVMAKILAALNGAPGATCGGLVVTRKDTVASPATLTLTDGTVVKWADVTSVSIGRQKIDASQIAKLYGGRDASVSVEIAGC